MITLTTIGQNQALPMETSSSLLDAMNKTMVYVYRAQRKLGPRHASYEARCLLNRLLLDDNFFFLVDGRVMSQNVLFANAS
jgi:hypothetical protein